MSPYKTGHKDTYLRDFAPIVADAKRQKWFLRRQDVPIGFEMLIIKNNIITDRFKPGMKWTSVVPFWHKGGVQAIVVDVRDRFEIFNFESELYTNDQYLLELKFAVHYRVSDINKVALHVKQPLEQLINRTRAKVLDLTLKTSIDDFIRNGSNIYVENLSSLADDFNEIGLEYNKVNVINFKLPDIARDKFARVMGENREMLMEIDRLRTMKEKGVIHDFMRLELIRGLANSNFPPMQLYAMQMLGLNPQQAGLVSPMAIDPSEQIKGDIKLSLPQKTRREIEEKTGIKKSTEVLDDKGTIIKKVDRPQICLVNLDTEKVYVVDKDVISLGRSLDNDIVINDEYVSRKQMEIVVSEKNELIVINFSSANLIIINKEKKIKPGERSSINFDDMIEVGYTRFKVVLR